MIAVIKTDSGNYNVLGTDGNVFILEGSLTKAQLEELIKKAKEALS